MHGEIKIGLAPTGGAGRYLTIAGDGTVDVSAVRIEDVALGLSRQPRFAGQTPRPYSVALHSVILADWVYRVLGPFGATLALVALLHDAPEALGVSDINRFVKLEYAPAVRDLEARVEAALAEKFGVARTPVADRLVKAYDRALGAAESNYFGWPVPVGADLAQFNPPDLGARIGAESSAEWDYRDFLAAWHQYTELAWSPVVG